MVYIRSYAFIVMGWTEDVNVFERQRQLDNYIEQFGASVMDEKKSLFLFIPFQSKFDYLAHRSLQTKIDPRRRITKDELKVFTSKHSKLKEIPFIE